VPRRKNQDKTSPRYLEDLGQESARAHATIYGTMASFGKISLPLEDVVLGHVLDDAIATLTKQGKLPWSGLPSERRQVFIDAWVDELTRLGIRR